MKNGCETRFTVADATHVCLHLSSECRKLRSFFTELEKIVADIVLTIFLKQRQIPIKETKRDSNGIQLVLKRKRLNQCFIFVRYKNILGFLCLILAYYRGAEFLIPFALGFFNETGDCERQSAHGKQSDIPNGLVTHRHCDNRNGRQGGTTPKKYIPSNSFELLLPLERRRKRQVLGLIERNVFHFKSFKGLLKAKKRIFFIVSVCQ